MADGCQRFVDRVAAFQAEKRALQAELRSAPPSEKVLLLRLIREADASIRRANAELLACRAQNPAPVLASIRMQLANCLNQDIRERLERALTDAFAEENAIAHSRCIGDNESVGIWVPRIGEEEGRVASLDLLPPRRSGESFGQVVEKNLIKRKVREDWDARPKAYNDEGEPDTDGPVFLTNLSYRMEDPDRVITTTDGFRKAPGLLPDIDFTVTTVDILGTEAGALHCDTTTDVDVDLDVFELLVELFIGGPLGAVRGLFRIASDIWDGSLKPEVDHGGVGCSILALFPSRIDLGDGVGAEASFSRVEAARGGFILAGGSLNISTG
jgi:hypothetical protein